MRELGFSLIKTVDRKHHPGPFTAGNSVSGHWRGILMGGASGREAFLGCELSPLP